jgi:hypothetical protein
MMHAKDLNAFIIKSPCFDIVNYTTTKFLSQCFFNVGVYCKIRRITPPLFYILKRVVGLVKAKALYFAQKGWFYGGEKGVRHTTKR